MTVLRDVVLDKEPGPRPPAPSAPRRTVWAFAALVLVAGAAALYWYGNRQNSSLDEPKQPARGDVQISAPPRAPLGIETTPVDLPPLDQSDALVRDLMRGLSSQAAVI